MKKKVNDILKGVAGAGVALGGAAAFGEMDVVYASELEDVTSQNNAHTVALWRRRRYFQRSINLTQ